MPDDPELEAYQAKEVRQLLNHDAVKRAFLATEDGIKTEWERAPTPEEREMCWHTLQAFRKLKTRLHAVARD